MKNSPRCPGIFSDSTDGFGFLLTLGHSPCCSPTSVGLDHVGGIGVFISSTEAEGPASHLIQKLFLRYLENQYCLYTPRVLLSLAAWKPYGTRGRDPAALVPAQACTCCPHGEPALPPGSRVRLRSSRMPAMSTCFCVLPYLITRGTPWQMGVVLVVHFPLTVIHSANSSRRWGLMVKTRPALFPYELTVYGVDRPDMPD